MNDLKFALRQLLKNPGFTAVAGLTLAVGIGASTAIYSVVNNVILNPVPGPEPDRLIRIAERNYHDRDEPRFSKVSPPVLEGLRANQDFFADLAWWHDRRLERNTEDFVDQVPGTFVSPNFFTLWDVPPILGRTFAEDETVTLNNNDRPAGDGVIILSHSWWKSLFHGDPDVLGRTIELSGHHFAVIGVMPRHFQFPAGYTRFWMATKDPPLEPNSMWGPDIRIVAHLKPGVSKQRTQAMLDTVAQQLVKAHENTWGYPEEWSRRPGGLGFWARPIRSAFQDSYGAEDLRRTLFGLLAAIGFVLLIVCANVANLTLARTERRQQELAMRSALGAGRIRLMRQLLIESVLLACLGGVGGMIVTFWGMNLLMKLIPETMPRMKAIQIDGQVLGVALLVSVTTGLLFGLAPAWRAAKTRLNEALKQAGSGATAGARRSRYRGGLVVVQVALALVLLAGAGLMIQSVIRLLHVDPGFDPENLLRVRVNLPWQKYAYPDQEHGERRNQILAELHERLAALPGVQAVGIKKQNFPYKFKIDNSTEPIELHANGCGVEASDPFRAMRVPLLAGRYLNRSDFENGYFLENHSVEGTSAVVINETMARLCWPGENPVGKSFRGAGPNAKHRYEVVGMVSDIHNWRYNEEIKPTFYRPYQEFDLAGVAPAFLIRTAIEPGVLIPAIRRELKAAEPAMRTPNIEPLRQTLYDSTQAQRLYMLYLVIFAGVGLFLAALGIYGVLAYSVARRTREIGIRMAVGAERRLVLGMVIGEGARLIGLGIAAGLVAAFWLTRLLQSQLFEVSPMEPTVFAGVVLILGAVALLACLLPARRAAKINPMEALRYE